MFLKLKIAFNILIFSPLLIIYPNLNPANPNAFENDLTINSVEVEGIPFVWETEVQARVWR